MKQTVLLYNFDDVKKRALSFILQSHKIKLIDVPKESFSIPIESLLDSNTISNGMTLSKPFTEEMMVFCHLEDGNLNSVLESMRQLKISVPLKAVLTEHNISWSSEKLYSELKEENRLLRQKKK